MYLNPHFCELFCGLVSDNAVNQMEMYFYLWSINTVVSVGGVYT